MLQEQYQSPFPRISLDYMFLHQFTILVIIPLLQGHNPAVMLSTGSEAHTGRAQGSHSKAQEVLHDFCFSAIKVHPHPDRLL